LPRRCRCRQVAAREVELVLNQDRVLSLAIAALKNQPSGLITDVDGTISRIAPSPEQAQVSLACRHALAALRRRLALVAVVSGRAAESARRLVGVPGLTYVGNHGLEMGLGAAGEGEVLPEARAYETAIAVALNEVALHTARLKGVRLESKGVTASVHYRLAEDPAAARRAILRSLAASPAARRLSLREGRMVVELTPPVAADKGTAVTALLRRHGLRGAVYLGDDVTDVAAFRALHAWRRETGGNALAIAVASAEAPETVMRDADLQLAGVAEVEALLSHLATELPPLPRARRREHSG